MFEELTVVDSVEQQPMLISWDLGRRCNYDCTYCPAHRHDNFSSLASLEELKASAEFMFEYLSLIMPFRKSKFVSVSFTGGEPTVNPNFIKFGKWLREEYQARYKNAFEMTLALTSNGATSRGMCDSLIENFSFATISYHCEANDRFKTMVVDNIIYLKQKEFPLKINVMFHAREDYFEECKVLCDKLASHGIDFVPRLIGEYEDNNRYHHKYTDEQMAWMRNFWQKSKEQLNNKKDVGDEEELETVAEEPIVSPKATEWSLKKMLASLKDGLSQRVITNQMRPEDLSPQTASQPQPLAENKTEIRSEPKLEIKAQAKPPVKQGCDSVAGSCQEKKSEAQHSARSLGRPCCGKRELNVCNTNKQWEKTSFLNFAKFKGWYCSVNWFFLHIEQQSGLIYHHQTCQANFGGKREPIGSLTEAHKIIDNLRSQIQSQTMPVITCPNKICGCGLCTPKASSLQAFKDVFAGHVDQSVFAKNSEFQQFDPVSPS